MTLRQAAGSFIGSNKPWEVAVGQSIAQLTWSEGTNFEEEGKMLSYLGKKVAENLIHKID